MVIREMIIDTIDDSFGGPDTWEAVDWAQLEGVADLVPLEVERASAASPLRKLQLLRPGPASVTRTSLLAAASKDIPGDFSVTGRGGMINTGRAGTGGPSNRLLKALGQQSCFLRIDPKNITYEMESVKDSTG